MVDFDGQSITLRIEYRDFITRYDLDAVLSSIDRLLEREFDLPESGLSYVGITEVSGGSVSLTLIAATAVAMYVERRFMKGVNKSKLSEQIQRSGRLSGDIAASFIEKVNKWAEGFVRDQRDEGGNITDVHAEKKCQRLYRAPFAEQCIRCESAFNQKKHGKPVVKELGCKKSAYDHRARAIVCI